MNRLLIPAKLPSLFLWLLVATIALWVQGCDNTAAPTVEGVNAPAFTLPSANGESVSLSDYVGEQPVLLYFHMAVG